MSVEKRLRLSALADLRACVYKVEKRLRLSALADLSQIEDPEEVKAQKALFAKKNKKKKRKQAEETDDSEEDASEDESESERPKSWDAHNKKKKFMKMAKEVNAF